VFIHATLRAAVSERAKKMPLILISIKICSYGKEENLMMLQIATYKKNRRWIVPFMADADRDNRM
jgi:hypothetical protein